MGSEQWDGHDAKKLRFAEWEWDEVIKVLGLLAKGRKQQSIAKLQGKESGDRWVRRVRDKALLYPAPLIDTMPPFIQDYLVRVASRKSRDLRAELEDLRRQRTGAGPSDDRHKDDLAAALLQCVSNLRVYGGPSYFSDPEARDWLLWMVHLRPNDAADLEPVDSYLSRQLLSHLRSTVPELARLESWDQLRVEQLTARFLDRLSRLAYTRAFEGKCDACPGQEQMHGNSTEGLT